MINLGGESYGLRAQLSQVTCPRGHTEPQKLVAGLALPAQLLFLTCQGQGCSCWRVVCVYTVHSQGFLDLARVPSRAGGDDVSRLEIQKGSGLPDGGKHGMEGSSAY